MYKSFNHANIICIKLILGYIGQNTAHAKVHGNRGAQLNPNNNLKIPILIKIGINFFS